MYDDTNHLTSEATAYQEVLGETGHDTFLVANLTSINCFSVIYNLFDENINPINWNNQKYQIYASNSAYDEIPADPSSYYEVMIRPEKFPYEWTLLKTLPLGYDQVCSNSFDELNWQNTASPLFFKYAKFFIGYINDCRIRIVFSGR